MSGTIVTVSALKRLDLSNGQALRRPVYLSNWTTMRIGLHVTFPAAASIVGTPRLWFGMGSGLTNGVGDATTTNFVGIYTNTATWTRTLSGAQAYAGGIELRLVKRVGAVTTQHATGGMTANTFLSLDAAFRSVLMLDITKGSPNYSFAIGHASSNSALIANDITPALMDSYMSLPAGFAGIGSVGNPNYAAVTATNATLAASEAAGVLDCVQLLWDKTAANCELEAVYHRKLA